MSQSFEIIAWDFDGTIADSRAMAFKHCSAIASLFGETEPVHTMEQYRRVLGRLESSLPADSAHHGTLRALHRILMRASACSIRPFPDVIRIIERSRIPSMIITAALRDTVQNSLGADVQRFAQIHAAEDGPKTNLLRAYIKSRRVIFITDTVTDLRRCAEVSVPTIAVGWGYDSFHDLAAARPAWLADTPQNLEQIFSELALLNF